MRLSILFAWATLLGAPVLGVSSKMGRSHDVIEMKPVQSGQHMSKESTFWGVHELAEGTRLNMEQLHQYASAAFNWLSTETTPSARESDGTCLVSALWIPPDHKVYLSTKAKGQVRSMMEVDTLVATGSQRIAPLWAGRATQEDKQALITNTRYHAEDSAYYLFESERAKQGRPTMVSGKKDKDGKFLNVDGFGHNAADLQYPPGSMIATWGYYRDENPLSYGRPIELCNPNNKNLKGRKCCQDVAVDLGIQWEPVFDPTPAQVNANDNVDLGAPEGDGDICVDSSRLGGAFRQAAERRWVPRGAHQERADACTSTYTVDPKPMEPAAMTPLPAPDDAESPDGAHATSQQPEQTDPPARPDEGMAPPEPTKPPKKPECWMQNALPDQYTSAFCRCTQDDQTKTLPLLTVENPKVDTQSCDYTEMPSKTENPVTEVTATYTIGCDMCAGPGGIENHDPSWCKPIAGCVEPIPTYEITLSDTSTLYGTVINEGDGDGHELGQALADKIKEHCPEDAGSCDTDSFDVMDAPVIIDEGVEYMKLQAVVDSSDYNSTRTRDFLVYSLSASIVNAVKATCVDVGYKDDAELGESGCGEGPIQKRHPPLRPPGGGNEEGSGLERRLPPTDADGADPIECTYTTKMCAGPKVVNVILGTQDDPYLNKMGISIELVKDDTGFNNPIAQWFCKAVVEGLSLAMMRYMPKLAGFEIASEIEDLALEVICGE